MKKNVQWAALLVALSLVFLACPQSDTKTTTIINWITPLNSLDISLGTNNDAIDFSFNETNPAAEKYILFHITGLVNTAASIISGGTSVEVTDITGTIGGFQPGTTHSFVVVAQYAGLPPSISPVKNITLTPFAIIIDDDIEGGSIESNKD
ncbi:MAG: hypothetical protein FWD36_05150, partial [Treponema sp.]|nr:hypothetical protein [Treponema sp.]